MAERVNVAEGVAALTPEAADGRDLPRRTPGAHIDLVLEPAKIRQYSLCGNPHDLSSWTIAILREPAGRGGSERVHASVVAGSWVTVGGPRNNFPSSRRPSTSSWRAASASSRCCP